MILFGLILVWGLLWPSQIFLRDYPGIAPGINVVGALHTNDVYAWSPDGQRFAYVTEDGIWITQAPDFRQPTLIVRDEHQGREHEIPQLRWSPNGEQIAFGRRRPGDNRSTL